MSRGIRRQPARVPVELAKDTYPQHAKMHPFTQENWAIREFMVFVAGRKLTELGFDEVNDLILQFRGVDKLEYEAESADMRSKYRWLWEQHDIDLVKPGTFERVVATAATRVAQAALPEKGPEDGLAFLLAKIRGEEAK